MLFRSREDRRAAALRSEGRKCQCVLPLVQGYRAAQQPRRGEGAQAAAAMPANFCHGITSLIFQKSLPAFLSCYVGEILRRKELSFVAAIPGCTRPEDVLQNMLGIFRSKGGKEKNSMIVMRYKRRQSFGRCTRAPCILKREDG